jgi:hypothetical protein
MVDCIQVDGLMDLGWGMEFERSFWDCVSSDIIKHSLGC